MSKTNRRRPVGNGRARQPNQTQTSDAATTARDAAIWQLRVEGHSLRAIGAQVGLSHVRVHEILEHQRAELIYPLVEQSRTLELERLDELLTKLRPALDAGDVPAVLAAIRIGDRRAKLLGLDAPAKVEADHQVTQVEPRPELLDRIAAAQADVDARQAALVAASVVVEG